MSESVSFLLIFHSNRTVPRESYLQYDVNGSRERFETRISVGPEPLLLLFCRLYTRRFDDLEIEPITKTRHLVWTDMVLSRCLEKLS